MSKLYRVTTSADSEGRSRRTIGYFKTDNISKIAEYVEVNNISYAYCYYIKEVDIIDVVDLPLNFVNSVKIDDLDQAEVTLNRDLEEHLSKLKLTKSALSKLSADEIIALGLGDK